MEKLNLESIHGIDLNIKKLEAIFPECVQDGKVDFDGLKSLFDKDFTGGG